MTNIILSGANGKMGKVISRLAAENQEAKICAGFDINTMEDDGFPVYSDPYEYSGLCDVIIDFSHPSAFERLLEYALSRRLPIVVATTGLSAEQIEKLKAASSEIPVFYSANMSLGVNLIIDLVKRAEQTLRDNFDIEIIEKHHNKKIDAPSGTALAIANAISENSEKDYEYVYDRHSVRRRRDGKEIGIHAVRGGTIVGEHSIVFAGNDEIIEIKHTALSKEIFAVGAVRAAEFLKDKPAGLYDMNDVIAD